MTIDLKILEGKYPAKAHAKKVKEWIAANGGDASGVIYLEGQKQKYNEVRPERAPNMLRRELKMKG
jgi:Xaa-Pro dipeptidase